LYPALSDIAAIKTDGKLELILMLSKPSALLPEELTVLLSKGDQHNGTGPYRFAVGNKNVLEAFDRYYQGKPPISRVVVQPSITLRTAWSSLLRGEVDAVSDVPADAVEFIRNDQVNVISFPRWYQFLIAFRSQQGPLRSAAVRRALNLAIDRDGLVLRVLKGYGSISTGPIWPKYWAYDATVPPFGNDAATAEALLEAAGFRRGDAAPVPGAPPARLRFTCILPQGYAVWERLALEVQRNLYAIGVDMELQVLPAGTFNDRVQNGAFEAAFIDMISGPTPGRAHLFWRSPSSSKSEYNVFGYDNPEVERQFDVLRSSLSEAAVRSATRRLQRLFLDDPPAIFLAWDQRSRAVRREFVVPTDDGRDPLLMLSQWTPAQATLRASVQ
jgi:peptide/nickel transport system substrate-binding protein